MIDSAALDNYKQSKQAVAEELHDDLAETLEELRKSQEILDQLASDMVSNRLLLISSSSKIFSMSENAAFRMLDEQDLRSSLRLVKNP